MFNYVITIAFNVILLFWLLHQGCQHQPVIKQGYTLLLCMCLFMCRNGF